MLTIIILLNINIKLNQYSRSSLYTVTEVDESRRNACKVIKSFNLP